MTEPQKRAKEPERHPELHTQLGKPMILRMRDDLRSRLSREAFRQGMGPQELAREILHEVLPPPE